MRAIHGVAALVAAVGLSATAATGQQVPDSARIAELERRIEVITGELERMRVGQDEVLADSSVRGFGQAASKVYRVHRGVSFGGYGEVLYENFAASRDDGAPAETPDRVDALRAILYVGYKFDDRLVFNSEIEVEHGNEIGLEFAYMDYLLTEQVGVRAGLLLAPMGLVNELHEPPVFLGTERPVTESLIIPTTWRENGIGLFGGSERIAWRVYVMNSFDGSRFGAAGIRGGRQKGSKALVEDLGVVGRLDYVGRLGLIAGGSAFYGRTGQGRELDGEEVGGGLFLWDLHADYKVRGFDLRALVAGAHLNDVTLLNDLNGLSGDDGVGKEMLGWYLQGGYDVLRGRTTTHQLLPYVRYERVDTQRRVVEGFDADPERDLSILSLGAAWKPVPQVVAKIGYQLHSNAADTGIDQWNIHLGWLF